MPSHKQTIASAEYYKNIIIPLVDNNEISKALELIKLALTNYPNEPIFHVLYAYCFTEKRKFRLANKHLKIAKTLDPQNDDLLITLSNYYIRRNRYKLGENYLLAYFRKNPTINRHIKIIQLYERMYLNAKTKFFRLPGTKNKIFKKNIKVLQDIKDVFNLPLLSAKYITQFYCRNRLYKKASQSADLCITLDPIDPWGYFMKSAILLDTRRYKEARTYLKKGLALNPNDNFGLRILAHYKAYTPPWHTNYCVMEKIGAIVFFLILAVIAICLNIVGIIFLFSIIYNLSKKHKKNNVDKELQKLKSLNIDEKY